MIETGPAQRTAQTAKGNPTRAAQKKPLWRTLLLWTHMTLGLSVGLFLVMMGLTGASMIFRPQLERMVYPALMRAGPAGAGSADACLAAVKLATPGTKLLYLNPPMNAGASMSFVEDTWEGKRRRRQNVYAAADGQGGCRILGIRKAEADPLGWVMSLHHTLLLGTPGQTILGYAGCGVCLLAISGLVLWWPKRWTPSRFKLRASARPLHYGLGFWVMIPLLMTGATGTYLGWKDGFSRVLVGEPTAGIAVPGITAAKGKIPVSLDAALAAVHIAAPAANPSLVRIAKLEYPLTVEFEEAGQSYRQSTGKAVVVAAADGTVRVARLIRERDEKPGERLLAAAQRVHQAEWGGTPVKALWCVVGLAPAVLFGSGFLMWRRRVFRAGKG